MAVIRTLLVLVILLLTGIGSLNAFDPPRPNILLILADDLGFSDLGCHGGEIQTPNLNSIAEQGLRFTQFYNTARCWPTRAALLTGYYPQQVRRDAIPGVPSGGGGRRPDWAVLLPKMLKPAGYRSYHSGKWHIDGMPLANGFDRSYYLKDQSRFFSPTQHWMDDEPLPPVARGTGFYGTTAVADHVVEVLQQHHAEHAEQPFFHYVAFAAPHFPLHALPDDIAVYEDVYASGWDTVRADRWQRMRAIGLLDAAMVPGPSRPELDLGPPYHFPEALQILGDGEVNRPLPWRQLTTEQQKFQSTKMAIHAAMVHRMDLEIGRIFKQIRQMGVWNDTIVMFLSDNGASAEIMVRGDGHDPTAQPGSADTYLCLGPGWSTVANTPFRRHKTWTHEGGISTPMLVSWPNGISARGELRRDPAHVIDVVPTLLQLAGAERADDAPEAPGISLLPAFQQDDTVQHDALWWFHDGHKAIRMGDWKAVAPLAEPWELYDLSHDRIESRDMAVSQHQKLRELVAAWDERLSEFTTLASADLDESTLQKARTRSQRSGTMNKAQQAALPKRNQVLINAKTFLLKDRHAFVMEPPAQAANDRSAGREKPWIFYAPTLAAYPDKAEQWMHQQFLDAGVAVAGIDVGEAYGSPQAFPFFEELYQHMVANGFSKTPALLGRSRGGLWVSSWALQHPDRVAGIGGIYPVYDFTTYPGLQRASSAYGLTPQQLEEQQDALNPVRRADQLAAADIPVFIIHGIDDKVVPLQQNSAAVEEAYRLAGKPDLIEVVKVPGQGHNFWEGFFHCQELVDFLIARAKGE